MVQAKGLPASGHQVLLWWRKRRLVCAGAQCPRWSFTETIFAVLPRGIRPTRCGRTGQLLLAADDRLSVRQLAGYDGFWRRR